MILLRVLSVLQRFLLCTAVPFVHVPAYCREHQVFFLVFGPEKAADASKAVSSALLVSTLLCFSVASQHFKGFRPREKAQRAETQFLLRLDHCHLMNSGSWYYIITHVHMCNNLLYLSNWLNRFHRENLGIQALDLKQLYVYSKNCNSFS